MSGDQFEERVRRLVRAKWDLPAGDAGKKFISIQEVDLYFEKYGDIFLIMCTKERKADKIRRDAEKLHFCRAYLTQQGSGVVGPGAEVRMWEITLEEPTGEQRKEADKAGIKILSVEQLQRSLIDVEGYLRARTEYKFGSAADPLTESSRLADDEYIPVAIESVDRKMRTDVRGIARALEDGTNVVLTADFGAGKSLTLREVYRELVRRYTAAEKGFLPIAINLREHWGQEDVEEVLTRHAKKIGYPKSYELIQLWNRGQGIALLDGFDELAIQPLVAGHLKRKEARHAAMTLVRAFVAQARGNGGVMITGRGHYFDTFTELETACGIRKTDWILELSPFDTESAQTYLTRKGIDQALPDWLPKTPLLLGYLARMAREGRLPDISDLQAAANEYAAWDRFLDLICARDAELSKSMDGPTARRILERLATRSRTGAEGMRAIDDRAIGDAYQDVTGSTAFEATDVLVQRLPGLTVRDSEAGHRAFVDKYMTDFLRAGDALDFLQNPFQRFVPEPLHHPLSAVGCAALAFLAEQNGRHVADHVVAAEQAQRKWNEPTLAADMLVAIPYRTDAPPVVDCKGLCLKDGYIDTLDTEGTRYHGLTLRDCIITAIRVGQTSQPGLLIEGCLIVSAEGLTSTDGLPAYLIDCTVSEFEDASTNSAVLRLDDLPIPVRVGLTVIRKLFVQRGRGRVEGAFWRGLRPEFRGCVPDVLKAFKAEGWANDEKRGGEVVWQPNPIVRAQALAVLRSPTANKHPLIARLLQLG